MKVVKDCTPGRLIFTCPGCGDSHVIQHGEGRNPRWFWNGSYVLPTIHPSLLVTWDHTLPDGSTEHHSCHSFITDGKIQFLSDSTHALSGQTVPIPPWVD